MVLHDRRERIVHASRDTTISSKRLIFLLHRLPPPEHERAVAANATAAPLASQAEERAQLLERATQDRVAICRSLASLHDRELAGQNYYRFRRSFAPGLEEFLEAATFGALALGGRLPSPAELESEIAAAVSSGAGAEPSVPVSDAAADSVVDGNAAGGSRVSVRVPVEEYALGVADATGELMRACITLVARGEVRRAEQVCVILRELAARCESQLPPQLLRGKLPTMRASVLKAEAACFNVKVRGSEYPQHMWQEAVAGHGLEALALAGPSELDNVDAEV
ncbi:hypothetical protein HK405_001027 [Cladochytrium tenue]|nr:hypothetical protein HK405_001027 [Cladochytrium tenue]